MKTYKKETFTQKVVDKELCDWCGKEIIPIIGDVMDTFTLKYEKTYDAWGDHWTEPDSWAVDLCPECIEKVKKFLVDGGAKLRTGNDVRD